ncbi:laminin subunit beta-1-like [Ursus arctos]|uniref:laminin subunit beta-1-like n=1 Tax=Ursus arctos TaxID=9644 RepID=UPI000E6E0092|nr:laminin subunit beta-1-like [Ursus arctos]XP_057168075.1 laminin subunit beta-1-like [Ursus arctos]
MGAARTGLPSTVPEVCAHLVCSISALLHGGGLACDCCASGTYGFGSTGCSECRCHTEGATGTICNPVSGQCTCWAGLADRRCDHCLSGRRGFPCCWPCACSGHAELCHPLTGICQACWGATTGQHCERCLDGYYGDPTLGSGQQCRPCPCPGHPGSGLYHGISCHVDSAPAATTVPLDALGTLGQRETPEGVHAGPVSTTIISIRMTLLPATPTVATASAVCTTAMVAALPTAGLASMAVPCIQGATVVSVWLGWVRTSQGRWVGSPSSGPPSSPGCSCDPQGTVPARCPLGLKPPSATRSAGSALAAPIHRGRTVATVPPSPGTRGDPGAVSPAPAMPNTLCSWHVTQ